VSRKRDAVDACLDEFSAALDQMNGDVLDVVGHALRLDGGDLAYVGSTLLGYRPYAENGLARIRLRRWCLTTALSDPDKAGETAKRLEAADQPWPALGGALAAALEIAPRLYREAAKS
jgi:hypothetical protein